MFASIDLIAEAVRPEYLSAALIVLLIVIVFLRHAYIDNMRYEQKYKKTESEIDELFDKEDERIHF